jgi:uncharacterized protein YbjT (DUF2867 family)
MNTKGRHMRILIAGSHGKVGRRLVRILADRGHEVVALIRDPDQAEELGDLGGSPLVADLTGDVSHTPAGCDAVVFTAGAGPGSGPGPKQTVDRGGAEKLVDAAREHGVPRFVMVSSIGAHAPAEGPEAMRPYLEAKQQADDHLAASLLGWTIVRPGSLSDDPGTGRVKATTQLGNRGPVTRDDVAATLAAVVERNDLNSLIFELFAGDTPIDEALDSLAQGG